jgi:hypothetical protein
MRIGAAQPVLAAILLSGVVAARAAEISGKVILQGSPPPEIPVDLTSYPECRAVRKEPLTTRHYVVAKDGGLANVFVYINEGLAGQIFSAPTNTPVLDQYNCGFHPYVLGVQTNQIFLIKNSEPYMDTVLPTPTNNKAFNIAQPAGTVMRVKFPNPEVLIKMHCAIHPWEFAFIGVVEHPFFAVTNTNGTYRFPDHLPAGRYVIEAVHPKLGRKAQEITVTGQERKNIPFVFEVKPKPLAK